MAKQIIHPTKLQWAAFKGVMEDVGRARQALALASKEAEEVVAEIAKDHDIEKIPDGVSVAGGMENGQPIIAIGSDDPKVPAGARVLRGPRNRVAAVVGTGENGDPPTPSDPPASSEPCT